MFKGLLKRGLVPSRTPNLWDLICRFRSSLVCHSWIMQKRFLSWISQKTEQLSQPFSRSTGLISEIRVCVISKCLSGRTFKIILTMIIVIPFFPGSLDESRILILSWFLPWSKFVLRDAAFNQKKFRAIFMPKPESVLCQSLTCWFNREIGFEKNRNDIKKNGIIKAIYSHWSYMALALGLADVQLSHMRAQGTAVAWQCCFCRWLANEK